MKQISFVRERKRNKNQSENPYNLRLTFLCFLNLQTCLATVIHRFSSAPSNITVGGCQHMYQRAFDTFELF